MVGHSKWSKVKHIKGPRDVKSGAAFRKLVKEITVAAPMRGGLSGNLPLRLVIETARTENIRTNNFQESDDYDDTQNVHSNPKVPEGILARLGA